jgi:AcrR family transcriptional regulator
MSRRGPTREAILDHALAAFNERGVEAVGMRDLASELGMSPGNLTYHFATKEDVLLGLAERLSAHNAGVLGDAAPDGLDALLVSFRTVFETQVAFRSLVLSVVHLTEHYPRMAARYRANQERRQASFRSLLRHLQERGSLTPGLGPADVERLVGTISLIGRFWLSEVRLDHPERAPEALIDAYLAILAGALKSSATAQGREELARFLRTSRGRATVSARTD